MSQDNTNKDNTNKEAIFGLGGFFTNTKGGPQVGKRIRYRKPRGGESEGIITDIKNDGIVIKDAYSQATCLVQEDAIIEASTTASKNIFSLSKESGSTTFPSIDMERFPNREDQGLEGPFRTKSGKVVYYDRKEGKYYDPTTDMFISQEDYNLFDKMADASTKNVYKL